MKGKKAYIIIAIIVLAIGAVGAVIASRNNSSSDSIDSLEASMSASDLVSDKDAEQVIDTSDGQSTAAQVIIRGRAYSPARITVKKGTTVTWVNQDVMGHDVTPDVPTADFQQSRMLGRGESYSVTFNETGTFTYFCTPHPDMVGVVEVVE